MMAPMRAFALATALTLLLAPAAQAAELEAVFFENKLDAVERDATTRLRRAPEDLQALAWRAETLMKQGAFADARADLARLPAAGRDAAIARGDFAWYTGDWDGALREFKAAQLAQPGDPHAVWGEASALLHLDRYQECLTIAEPLIARAASEGPAFQAWALVLRGAALGRKADRGNLLDKLAVGPKAKEALEAALRVDPANANALSALGRFHYVAPLILGGDPNQAVGLLEKSKAVDPYFYLNHAYLIRALRKTGQLDKAKVEATYYRAKFQGLPAAERELAAALTP
jgi:tetratricopeptide (TPR) repeat protein